MTALASIVFLLSAEHDNIKQMTSLRNFWGERGKKFLRPRHIVVRFNTRKWENTVAFFDVHNLSISRIFDDKGVDVVVFSSFK